MEFAIVDIETTGGLQDQHRITEIGIVIHNGAEVVDQFSSLVNPERWIPPSITSITGIDDKMVAEAPKFEELAQEIFALTNQRVFVAHSVGFDYGFLKKEFGLLGIRFNRKRVCTVRLSRKVFPNLKSYSLGKLCNTLGIKVENRHRALGDAKATAELFSLIRDYDLKGELAKALNQRSREMILPRDLAEEKFWQLPTSPGVYYFKDSKGKTIYVGKAKNVQKRVASHFTSTAWNELQMKAEVADLDFQRTGNELIALLLESAEIKKIWPKFNAIQLRSIDNVAVFSYLDQRGYRHLALEWAKKAPASIAQFSRKSYARSYLRTMANEFGLCPKFCALQKSKKACFDYGMGTCDGACAGEISVEEYNLRVEKAIAKIEKNKESFIIKEKGREEGEQAFVVVENGGYLGYGYLSEEENVDFQNINAFLKRQKDNNDVQRILREYINKPSNRSKIIFSQLLEEEK